MQSKKEHYFELGTIIKDPEYNTQYTLSKFLGRGAYAQCFLAVTNSNESYAMKIVRLSDIKSKKVREKLGSEIEIHSKLNHPNIVKMYRNFQNDEYVFMILELCEKGALDTLLKRNTRFKEKYVVRFVQQIVHGMIYLHNEMSVVHRDLKLGNLFLDSRLNVKIGDFGLSAFIKDGERKVTMCGTPNYIAPEVLFDKENGHSYEVDIWSLGVIIYTLLIGVPPFQKKNVEEIYKKIKQNNYIFPDNCDLSSEAIDLISKILTTNPLERPSLEEIVQHRFLVRKEHFLLKVYKNIMSNKYIESDLESDYIVFSIPITKNKGVGYILKSGIHGFFFNDNRNIMLKKNKNSIVFINVEVKDGKKVFFKEEHLVTKIPPELQEEYNILHGFIKTFGDFSIDSNIEPSFIIKVRKIKYGILFVMADTTIVFDFTDNIRVVVSTGGEKIITFKNNNVIPVDEGLKDRCIDIIKGCLGYN